MAPEVIWASKSSSLDDYGLEVTTIRSYGCAADLWSLGEELFFADWRADASAWAEGTKVWAKRSETQEWDQATVMEMMWSSDHKFPSLLVRYTGTQDTEVKQVGWGDDWNEWEVELCDGSAGGWWDLDGMYEDICSGSYNLHGHCLLYTSDAADEEDSVDLGGRRIIKKKKYINAG
eukprot:TRINITY_DN14328_c0_g1_i1.p1 TRINITY_DN14328_c0_g1~~TRINITY_DN14328_c0_g1_i1.p1  ORF type:complete len:176 (-),score=32.68 TRINITY_DN14328_c0_g1_i1:46-573(-)